MPRRGDAGRVVDICLELILPPFSTTRHLTYIFPLNQFNMFIKACVLNHVVTSDQNILGDYQTMANSHYAHFA